MNREFQEHSSAGSKSVKDTGGGVLLSTEEALELIEAGVDIISVLARLDVDQCHFMPRVDDNDGEIKPLIETGFPCDTLPSSGVLSFSIEEVEKQHALGNKVIFVAGIKTMSALYSLREKFSGLMILRPEKIEGQESLFYDHFLPLATNYPSALLDNPSNPQMIMSSNCKEIQLNNERPLSEGDVVTIDPMSGRLWRGKQPMLQSDEDSRILMEHLHDLSLFADGATCVALHTNNWYEVINAEIYKRDLDRSISIGLQRTDMECCQRLCNESSDSFVNFSKGVVPPSLRNWDYDAFCRKISRKYRLPDLHNLRDALPEKFKEALDKGEDHVLGVPLFKMRETLYRHQLKTAFSNGGILCKEGTEITIIIPSIETAEEVEHFKKLVEEVTPDKLKDQVGFGVMMETEAALGHTREIAAMCDCLCYGTNDLTAEILKLSRSNLDYSEWMSERGLKGRSPFETFAPEVLERLEDSIRIAKEVNPDIVINICGHQVAGHDIDSILAVLKMGVDMITVQPSEENFNRARLAVAQHAARQELACKPQASCDRNLSLL
jgi:hypothetical protein